MGEILQVRKAYRMEQWRQIIQECQKSGLSNKAYCQQQGISEKTYYYWLRKLRTAAELRQVDKRSFRWLMEGLQIDQPKAIRKGKAKDLF